MFDGGEFSHLWAQNGHPADRRASRVGISLKADWPLSKNVRRGLLVPSQDLSRKGYKIADPLAGRLSLGPELQIFWPAVIFDAVLVMFSLERFQGTPEDVLHDEPVFHDVLTRADIDHSVSFMV